METTNTLYRDLYLMLAPNLDTKHLLRSNRREEGFEDFVSTNKQFLYNEPIVPNNWMFHYHFTEEQAQGIKALSGLRNRDFFRNLLPSLLERDITPQEIYTMDEAHVLRLSDIPLNKIIDKDFELSLVRPPFNAYVAVDTAQGVLLFTPTQDGNRLFEGYMQHLADTFFQPQIPQNFIAVSKIPAFDPALKPYVNRCPKFSISPFGPRKELSLEPEIFAPKSILKSAVDYVAYDMNPTWDNFCQYVFPTDQSALHCSQQNYDIMRLLHTAQTGEVNLNGKDFISFTFSHLKDFSDLLSQGFADKESSIARSRAENILKREYPSICASPFGQIQRDQLHIAGDFTADLPRQHKL